MTEPTRHLLFSAPAMIGRAPWFLSGLAMVIALAGLAKTYFAIRLMSL
jgi:hypothetical protein